MAVEITGGRAFLPVWGENVALTVNIKIQETA